VYILPDHANASIPADIREQFQRDEQGRVLFFTAPPVNSSRIVKKEGQALGHSARYLALKAKRDAERAAKRNADEANAAERVEAAKKARIEAEQKLQKDVAQLRIKAMHALEDRLRLATMEDLQMLMGNVENADILTKSLDHLVEVQEATISKNQERETRRQQQKSSSQIPITGMTAKLEEKI
jgi:chromatin structure-remodeling complex subunit RSC1/2